MAKIKTLKDPKEGVFYPITSTKAVVDDNGNSVDVMITDTHTLIENLESNTGVSEYPTFDETKAYAVGDVVIFEGKMYRFTSAHAAGAWDASQVESWSERKEIRELGTQVIYDVSANNDGATFASLSVLLSSENLSTLIPTAVRCGGMSIRFVQSSDNKYIQYRYMGTEVTGNPNPFLNTDNWQKQGAEVSVLQNTSTGKTTIRVGNQAPVEVANADILEDNVKTSPAADTDLNIADESGKVLAIFKNGGIKTKNFNTFETPSIDNDANDFSIKDENSNVILMIKQGHIFTKNFSSYKRKNIDCVGDSMVMGSASMGYFETSLQNSLGPDYNVRNFGVGGETKATVGARLGSTAIKFNSSFILPYDGSNVELPTMISRLEGYEVLPLKMGNTNVVNPCYVNGIECTMSYADGHYYLRSNKVLQNNVTIRANSNLLMSTGKATKQSYCTIVWFGQNKPSGVTTSTEYLDSLVDSYRQVINQMSNDNYIFIGLHLLGYAPNNLAEYYENKMYNLVGNKFFNIREYCCSDLIYEAGITPNETDLSEMALGQCPESLLIDGTHFKPSVNDCVGKRLFELMNELGYLN